MCLLCILQKDWLDAIRREWFACMAQNPLSPACVQCYITTLVRLSKKLLEIVVNLQDDRVRVSQSTRVFHLVCL